MDSISTWSTNLNRVISYVAKRKLKVIERKLGKEKAWGQYHFDLKLIEVDPRQSPKKYFNTICHEILHDCFPEMPEYKINKAAGILSRTLWKAKYRKIQE